MTIDEMIALLHAAKAGRAEWRSKPSGTTWFECSLESFAEYFNQPEYEFRVKPEPREFCIVLDQTGSVKRATYYPRITAEEWGEVTIKVREVL